MPISAALRRLLRVRDLIEEQHRVALESAAGELRRLERALEVTNEMARDGRNTVAASVRSGNVVDRIAGLAGEQAAERRVRPLVARIAGAEAEAARRRQAYVEKRIEKRQAETLIRETEAADALEAGRREQQRLDDWYGSRDRGQGRAEHE